MKNQIPPYAIIAAIVLIVAMVGFFGYKVLNPQVETVEDPKKTRERMIEQMRQNNAGGGYQQRSPAAPNSGS